MRAWAQTNGYTDGRPYKMNTRQEAVEEFMRWYAGARVHPVSSTMASRGESIGPFADAFIGNDQAEQIREAAFKRRASGWRRTAEVIGGPRLGTGTSTVHKARSVESPRKADTSEGQRSVYYPYRTTNHPHKMGGGTAPINTRSHDRTGMGPPASAGGPTTTYPSLAHIPKVKTK